MHTIKITPNLLFESQCTSGKFIRLPNRIETFLLELECSTVSLSACVSVSLSELITTVRAAQAAERIEMPFRDRLAWPQ